ncbi:reverse transcriptase domain-containing protein [Tanacetum coccineum]
MKDLVANKPRTEEDEEIRMNPRLNVNNALADLGANIIVMPLSMYKRLGIGKLKPINMVIEMADNTKCTPKGIVENLLIKIDKFIFPVDFVILDMVEDLRMPIILGRPLLATTHTKEAVYKMTEQEDPWKTEKMDEANLEQHQDLTPMEKPKVHWCKMVLERILKDHWREKFGEEEDDTKESLEDPKECEEAKAHTIIEAIHDKLNDGWFKGTSEDEDDLEGIIDYLKPRSYDGFIDLDNEAYNKRRCSQSKELEFEVSSARFHVESILKTGLVGYHVDDDDDDGMIVMKGFVARGSRLGAWLRACCLFIIPSKSRGVVRSNYMLIFNFHFLNVQ